jgi:hypothetical protein
LTRRRRALQQFLPDGVDTLQPPTGSAQEEAMTYPMAIVLAAALVAGAIIMSSHGNAAGESGAVALAATDSQTVWVARDDGSVRVCRLDSRGTAQLGVLCSTWN